jgi:hypothetical protein
MISPVPQLGARRDGKFKHGGPRLRSHGAPGQADDKGKGSAYLSSRYRGWTEPQVIRDFHLLG